MALVKAVFKVSDLIPDLIIREKIKKQNLEVYESFVSGDGKKNYSDLAKNIDTLRGFLFLAGQMNFIKEEHLKTLENGFLVFKSHLIIVPVAKRESVKQEMEQIEHPVFTERQEKILEKFKDQEIFKLAEITELFPNVSEKTIRNELKSLIELKKITRSGHGGSSFYRTVR